MELQSNEVDDMQANLDAVAQRLKTIVESR